MAMSEANGAGGGGAEWSVDDDDRVGAAEEEFVNM